MNTKVAVSHLCTFRVSQVRAEIDRLSDTFSDFMSDTRDEMCTRETVVS